MFSKFSGQLALILALGLGSLGGLIGCTPQVGEQPPESKPFALGDTKCLNQSANDLKKFLNAEAEEVRLTAAWSCINDALTLFEKYISGQDKNRYTSAEIVTFLESNFFEDVKKNKITPELQIEFMKLKQIFMGGDINFVTRDELRRSRDFINQISRMTNELNPHMKVIVGKWKPQIDNIRSADLATFEVANQAFRKFAIELSVLIEKHPSLYKIDDSVKLFKELEKFFDVEWDWVRNIEKLIPGFKKLKMALASGSENTINEKEWAPVVTLGARGYFQFLRYHYFIESTPETGGAIRLVYVARTLEDIFSILQDLVLKKPSGVITSKEVFEVLDGFQQFWTDLKVSEKLISELMKLKKVLVGGTLETWTAKDFAEAGRKVPELRRIIENFMPYYNIYSGDWDPAVEDPVRARAIFKESQVRLAVVAHDFGRFLQGAYSFDDLIELVTEFTNLYPSAAAQPSFFEKLLSTVEQPSIEGSQEIGQKNVAVNLKNYRGLFLQLKKMIYAQEDTVLQGQQWSDVFSALAKVFSFSQYHQYFLLDKSWKQTQAIEDLDWLVNEIAEFCKDIFQITKSGFFTQNDLVDLTLEFSKTSILSFSLTPETTRSLWEALLQHLLIDPNDRFKNETNDRLGMPQIENLRTEFLIWSRSQTKLNALFKHDPQHSLSPQDLMQHLKDGVASGQLDPFAQEGFKGIYTMLDSAVSFTWDADDHLEISNRVKWQYRMNALYQVNISRALTRIILRSFSTEVRGDVTGQPVPDLSRVSKPSLQRAFQLLVGVFRELKIFDPQPEFIDSRFIEANIFTSRGNGDQFMDQNELSELLNIIFSGLRVHKKLETSLRMQCPIFQNAEGKEFVTFKCMSEHHYVKVRQFMAQLPEFKAYVESLSAKDKRSRNSAARPNPVVFPSDADDAAPPPEQQLPDPEEYPEDQQPEIRGRDGFRIWNKVFKETLKATGWKPNKGYGSVKEESVLLADSLYYPFIVHYTELLFARFDTSKNGYLQLSEARRAFPVFRPLLKEIAAGKLKDSELLPLFTYILRYKVQPDQNNSSKARWLQWKFWWEYRPSKIDGEIYASRTDMAQVLGLIGGQ